MNLHVLRSATSCLCRPRLTQHLASRPLLTSSAPRGAAVADIANDWISHAFVESDFSARLAFHSDSLACGKALTWQEDACSQSVESDWADERVHPSNKVQKIVDDISSLNLVEVSELTFLLKKRFGICHVQTLPMGMGIVPGNWVPAASNHYPAKEDMKQTEKSSFNVKVEKYEAASKGRVVKEIRAFTSLGLRDARNLLNKSPALVKEGVSKEEAKRMIEKLQAVGATAFME
ncbi:hypothetical protein O6H91_Y494100 [Diphasiastrum complanatum]|nr:hypothetical protein O6H91_Y494100 [Diphasiastrum complanatum]